MGLSGERSERMGIMKSCIAAGDAYIYWGPFKGRRSEGLDHPHSAPQTPSVQ